MALTEKERKKLLSEDYSIKNHNALILDWYVPKEWEIMRFRNGWEFDNYETCIFLEELKPNDEHYKQWYHYKTRNMTDDIVYQRFIQFRSVLLLDKRYKTKDIEDLVDKSDIKWEDRVTYL